jgi:hypothetical protein
MATEHDKEILKAMRVHVQALNGFVNQLEAPIVVRYETVMHETVGGPRVTFIYLKASERTEL